MQDFENGKSTSPEFKFREEIRNCCDIKMAHAEGCSETGQEFDGKGKQMADYMQCVGGDAVLCCS